MTFFSYLNSLGTSVSLSISTIFSLRLLPYGSQTVLFRMVLSGKIDEQLENVGNFCKNLCMFSSKIRLF